MKGLNWQTKIVVGVAAAALAAGMVGCSQTATTDAGDELGTEAQAAAVEKKDGGWLSSFSSDPVTYTLAAGENLVVRTTSSLSTKTNDSGETFAASLEEPLEIDGVVLAPKGSKVTGIVTSSDDGGRVKGVAQLGIALTEIVVNGKTYPISSGTFVQSAKKTVTKDAQKVGIGAGIGAAIGAIAGGGDGAAKGAGIGAGAGTATVLGTRGDPAVIPAESVINFTLSESITMQAD
ncbi:MAG: hypothetical protein O3A53_04825 [Acidobacteria bacterium]|nr:hypothetical protein [Acidobacteriota bacterium]MDA1234104.1 hypothetical protein [Acidobacteriota bacterium]